MLEQTRAELDDFHQSSKELETELENELQRTEKAQQDLKIKAARAENERDEWKVRGLLPSQCESDHIPVQVHVPANHTQPHDRLIATRA